MSNKARHPSCLKKWPHKLLKINQIFHCVKTGYRLKMHEGLQKLSCLLVAFWQVGLLHKKEGIFSCQSCRIKSVSGHQNKLSSCPAPVARRQLRNCTSFVFNLCNSCTSGLCISNVYHHSNVTEQHKICRHELPLLDSWWICFSDRGFFVYKGVT